MLKLSQGRMRGVRFGGWCQQLLTTLVVKFVDQRWIALEAFRGRRLTDWMVFPQAIGCTKGLDARLGRYASTGEYHYRLR